MKMINIKYFWDVRFLVGLLICAIILGPVAYYMYTDTDNDQSSNKMNDEYSQDRDIIQGQAHDYDQGNMHIHEYLNATNSSDFNPSTKPMPIPQRVQWENNEEIKIFREYLRIPSVHPNVDYKPCVDFLKKQADSLNLPVSISYPADKDNPVLVMTWKGSQPKLPTIMLNSHMDVVPAYEEFWTHPPFAAEMDENGDIFARGAQDMKSNAMQYLAAIRALKRDGIDRLKRTVHVVFVPDEELGGLRGMAPFVKTNEFKALNVAFVLDEGSLILNDEGILYAYYGQRTGMSTEFIFHGRSGHGSRLFNDTPGVKLNYVVGKMTEYREKEMRKFTDLKYPYGNVTTINLTKLKGGVEDNVIPAEMSVTFDIRVSINEDLDQFQKMIKRWCDEAGGNITVKHSGDKIKENVTAVDDSNPFWLAFKNATDEIGLKVEPSILTGGSDSRYIRRLNIHALGFSPLINTIPKLHDHDEYLNADTFLKGIDIYKKIIPYLANV